MNILIITYQGEITGSTNSIAFLAKGLAERGHHVVVGLRRESVLYRLLEGTPVHRAAMTFGGRLDYTNMKQIRDVVREHRIEIINAQSSKDRYTTIFAKWLFGLDVKIYHTRRQPPKSIGGLQNLFYIRGTEKIIVVSNELKRIFEEKGFPGKHLHVIHNGIPADRFKQWSPERVEEIRNDLKIREDERVIGCISRIKRQQQLVDAYVEMNDARCRLIFVGIAEHDVDLSAVPAHLTERIYIMGKVPIEDSLNWYRVFDVDVLASVTDGFGLVLVESMAMGCPVVATDFGGIRDVVRHGENGLLFEDGNISQLVHCLRTAFDDRDVRNRLLEGGMKTAYEDFTIENTITGYERFFLDELEGGGVESG